MEQTWLIALVTLTTMEYFPAVASLPNLPPGQLQEQVFQVGRAVQRPQVAMLAQRLQQGLRVLGVEEHRLAADLHARGRCGNSAQQR